MCVAAKAPLLQLRVAQAGPLGGGEGMRNRGGDGSGEGDGDEHNIHTHTHTHTPRPTAFSPPSSLALPTYPRPLAFPSPVLPCPLRTLLVRPSSLASPSHTPSVWPLQMREGEGGGEREMGAGRERIKAENEQLTMDG